MLIPTHLNNQDGELVSGDDLSLNAPQGFMLIPTSMPCWRATDTRWLVLMPLRASCSFQQNNFGAVVEVCNLGLNAPQGFMLIPTV